MEGGDRGLTRHDGADLQEEGEAEALLLDQRVQRAEHDLVFELPVKPGADAVAGYQEAAQAPKAVAHPRHDRAWHAEHVALEGGGWWWCRC